MAEKQDSIGVRALRFLTTHGLEQTPDHYAFAYHYVSGKDREFSDAVDYHIEGGVRLRAEALRALVPPGAWTSGGEAFGQLTTQLMELLRDAATVTGDFNRDLIQTAAALVSGDPPRVREMVSFMIERTAQAEASLSASLRQAQALRDTLNGAREEVGRDPLTGLPAQNAMADRLTSSVSAAEHCTIALVTVDQLPMLAVEHGDGMRDRVLKAVAMTLRDACSPHQVGRWGETSFLVLLENVGIETAAAVLEAARIDAAARHLKLRENHEPLGTVTLSVGVAASRRRGPGLMVEAAERLLIDAKATGGNRVVAETRLIGLVLE